jgi:LysM repeat protein
MDTKQGISKEVSPMSTMVAAHDFGFPRNASPRTSEVRLTRRGRVTLLVLLIAVAFALLTVFGGQSAATGQAGEPVVTRTVVVGEGDTLWGIAAEAAEPGEVRQMMHYVEELNALSSSSLMVGQELAVPVE